MELLIVTGMSGAGKSTVIHALEDTGFYCIDNMPAKLLEQFVQLYKDNSESPDTARIAAVMDIRSGKMFDALLDQIFRLRQANTTCKILFLDCSDSAIIHRYKETRRRHPLLDEYPQVEEAMAAERKILDPVKAQADYVIDSSLMTIAQLKERVITLFTEDPRGAIIVSCNSFGFKYGIPPDADMVFDLRCLPNPFYIKELKHQTGEDKPVVDYVLSFPEAIELLEKIEDIIDFLLPLYIREGRSQLTISIGCTGGRHRSVVFSREIEAFVESKGYSAVLYHRDIAKG